MILIKGSETKLRSSRPRVKFQRNFNETSTKLQAKPEKSRFGVPTWARSAWWNESHRGNGKISVKFREVSFLVGSASVSRRSFVRSFASRNFALWSFVSLTEPSPRVTWKIPMPRHWNFTATYLSGRLQGEISVKLQQVKFHQLKFPSTKPSADLGYILNAAFFRPTKVDLLVRVGCGRWLAGREGRWFRTFGLCTTCSVSQFY